MKKFFLLAIIVLISMIAAEAGLAQSQVYSGDKSLRENKKTIRLIKQQIDYCKIMCDSSASDSTLSAVYRQTAVRLVNQLNNLVASVASEPDRQSKNFKNHDPEKVAKAYLLIKYADGLKNGQNFSAAQATEADSGKLKGIIVNDWYYQVIAQVTGPANFFREFDLKPNTKSPVFTLPMIGDYVTTFIYGGECRFIAKEVGPNIVYYDGTTAFDYKATLPQN